MKKPLIGVFVIAGVLAIISTFVLDNSGGGVRNMVADYGTDSTMSTPSMGVSKEMIAPGYPMPIDGDNALEITNRVYEYSSYHSLVVTNVADYIRNIKEYIQSVDGRIINVSQQKNDMYDYGSLYAKVPVNTFDQSSQKITENVEKIISESIHTADRTGEVVNQTGQLEALRAEITLKQTQLQEAQIASQRVQIQNELNNLQRRLSALEQQATNTQEQVEYATVQISVADSESYFNPNAHGSLFEELKAAVRSLKGSFYTVAVMAIWLVVYSIILLPLFVIARAIKNKFWFTK